MLQTLVINIFISWCDVINLVKDYKYVCIVAAKKKQSINQPPLLGVLFEFYVNITFKFHNMQIYIQSLENNVVVDFGGSVKGTHYI